MKLILNADDFGLSHSINRGIVEGLRQGLVSSATIMMNTPFTDEAIELARKLKLKNIGIHLNLTYGFSVLPSNEVSSLVDETGRFHYVCMLGYYTQYMDAKKELRAQIEKFLKSGLVPTHLDYHHYFHEVPSIFKAYLELAKEYNLPVRTMTPETKQIAEEFGLITTDAFCFDFHNDYGVNIETLKHIIDKYKNTDKTIEVLTHIGYIDEYTQNETNYLIREREIEVLKQAKEQGVFDGIELVDFSSLKQKNTN